MGRPINVVNLHYYFIMSRKESGLDLFQHWQSLIQPEHMIKAGIYDYNCQRKLIVNWELWIIMAFAIKPFLSYLSQPTTALTTVCIQLSDYYVPPYAYEIWSTFSNWKLCVNVSSIKLNVDALLFLSFLKLFWKGEVTPRPLSLRHFNLHCFN